MTFRKVAEVLKQTIRTNWHGIKRVLGKSELKKYTVNLENIDI